MKLTTLSLIMTVLLLTGCTGSKKLSRKAAQLEEAGLVEEASSFYYQALLRSNQNIDARIGLKKLGQKQVDEKLNEFYKLHSMKNAKSAVYTYLEIKEYQDKVSPFVALEVPDYYEDYYTESKNAYLSERYDEANKLLDEEEFQKADDVLKEIIKIDPSYQDAGDLKSLTTVEPLYRKGVQAFESGNYRSSYNFMDRVLKQKTSYKDAIDYKNKARERALMTVAISPFEISSQNAVVVRDKIYAELLQDLLRSNDPFLKVIDRENTERIVQEQKFNMSNAVDKKTAIDAGKMLGAKAFITGKVLSYDTRGGRIQTEEKQAYEGYRVKKINPKTKKAYYATQYRKTSYTEYRGSSEVSCSVEFRMVSTQTGEVLVSDIVKVTTRDQVSYARYEGNFKNLYPGHYSSRNGPLTSSDKVITSNSARRQLASQFQSRSKLKSITSLRTEASDQAAARIAALIHKYNPE